MGCSVLAEDWNGGILDLIEVDNVVGTENGMDNACGRQLWRTNCTAKIFLEHATWRGENSQGEEV